VGKCNRAIQTTDDNIIRRMRIECCINMDTDTHLELRERASVLRHSTLRVSLN